jgi:uncharacterized protein (DUF2126 family)
MHLELRAGIEPWNVLGEEMTGGGTARYVDSSLERLQVKVSNFTSERYVLTCNGVKIQLQPTGTKGEYVAGVKYKAWDPHSALHPTIGVDTPLAFDIVDTWNRKSIGGCKYFVAHPGGRSYDTFPVNSYEAESRRINRFWDIGETQTEVDIIEEVSASDTNAPLRTVEEIGSKRKYRYKTIPVDPEFPNTLDLRKK